MVRLPACMTRTMRSDMQFILCSPQLFVCDNCTAGPPQRCCLILSRELILPACFEVEFQLKLTLLTRLLQVFLSGHHYLQGQMTLAYPSAPASPAASVGVGSYWWHFCKVQTRFCLSGCGPGQIAQSTGRRSRHHECMMAVHVSRCLYRQ